MASFEVYIQPVIEAEGCRLISAEKSDLPRISLESGVSWQNALRKFIEPVLGEVTLSFDLKGLETVKDQTCPQLVIHVKCYLARKAPLLDSGYRWLEPGSPTGRVVEGAKIDPACEVEMFTDGSSRGNPGPAGIGILLWQESTGFEEEFGRFIGTATSNEAEYRALIEGLKVALDRGVRKLDHLSDSQLLVRQLEGSYKVKAAELQKLFREVKNLIAGFASFRIKHIPREENSRADKLANQAVDELESSNQ